MHSAKNGASQINDMFANSVDAGTAHPRNAMKKVLYFQCKSSQLKHTSSSILMVQGRLQIIQKHGEKQECLTGRKFLAHSINTTDLQIAGIVVPTNLAKKRPRINKYNQEYDTKV